MNYLDLTAAELAARSCVNCREPVSPEEMPAPGKAGEFVHPGFCARAKYWRDRLEEPIAASLFVRQSLGKPQEQLEDALSLRFGRYPEERPVSAAPVPIDSIQKPIPGKRPRVDYTLRPKGTLSEYCRPSVGGQEHRWKATDTGVICRVCSTQRQCEPGAYKVEAERDPEACPKRAEGHRWITGHTTRHAKPCKLCTACKTRRTVAA